VFLNAQCEVSLCFSNIASVAVVAGDGVDASAGCVGGVEVIYACGRVDEVLDCLGGGLYDFYS